MPGRSTTARTEHRFAPPGCRETMPTIPRRTDSPDPRSQTAFAGQLRKSIAHRRRSSERRSISPGEDGEVADRLLGIVALVFHHEAEALLAEERKARLVGFSKSGILRTVEHRE